MNDEKKRRKEDGTISSQTDSGEGVESPISTWRKYFLVLIFICIITNTV
jgi:hypothetical protein